MRFFNTAGPCKSDIHYVLPPTERLPGVRRLIAQQSYFRPRTATERQDDIQRQDTHLDSLAERLREPCAPGDWQTGEQMQNPKENRAMARWTKQAAVDRVNNDPLVQEAMRLEPRLIPIIKEAMRQGRTQGYHRIQKYVELRNRVTLLVGQLAENEKLRTSEYYDAVRGAIDDLLPPDDLDLS